jgi:hypothetical protein
MRIEAITRRKIVVELSAEDMSALDITYEALDYASVDTRRVIWVILDRVRECTGCDIDPSGQLLIDAMPRPTGGCILFFTLRSNPSDGAEPAAEPFAAPREPGRALRKQEQLLAAFEFPDLDALLDCAGAYTRAASGGDALFTRSELYGERRGPRYRLLVCPAREPAAVRQFFSEYARPCGEDAFAAHQTREHWLRLGDRDFAFEGLGPCPAAAPPKSRAAAAFAPGNVYTAINN